MNCPLLVTEPSLACRHEEEESHEIIYESFHLLSLPLEVVAETSIGESLKDPDRDLIVGLKLNL
jgi:hypothetical protein